MSHREPTPSLYLQNSDLETCDREPIHIPAAVQPHGVLLVLREPELEVLQVSDSCERLLGTEPEQIVGQALTPLLDRASLEVLQSALSSERLEDQNPVPLLVNGRPYDGICHRHQGLLLVELEPSDLGEPSLRDSLRGALAALQSHRSVASLCTAVAQVVKRLTGFDRVVVYRFDASGTGSVIAESVDEGLERYLGLHYPASDIPRQARELYLRNWLRIIPDAHYAPARVVPSLRPDTGEPLDLSHSVLRSVSPVHLEYMRNMGQRASMSVSLVVGDALWGLISCASHRGPRFVRYESRAACEVIGRLMSLQLSALEEVARSEFRAARRAPLARLEESMRESRDEVLVSVLREGPSLLALVDARGAAAVVGDRCVAIGSHPSEDDILRLAQTLDACASSEVDAHRSLAELLPTAASYAAQAAGVLSFGLPGPISRRLLWFRPEVEQTVDWAGEPHKWLGPEEQPRIHPRRSFALWQESVRLCSLPWLPGELDIARELRRRAVEVDLALQVEREHEAVRARDDLVAVVSHDLKNPLSVVRLQSTMLLRGLQSGEPDRPERLRASADRILRSVDRMNTLINDLLDHAKIEAGRFEVNLAPEPIAQLLDEVLAVMSPLAEQRSIRLLVEGLDAGSVWADRDRIYQVLSNLISNALKFSREGGEVAVHAHHEGEYVRFSISDAGPGIPADQLPHIFRRYWQAPRTRRHGSGLGLYIAHGIVAAHRGRLWAESTVGVGSRFCFTLEAVDAPVALPER